MCRVRSVVLIGQYFRQLTQRSSQGVTGMESALDLTLVSNTLVGSSKWEVWTTTTLGSDHYPALCRVDARQEVRVEERIPKRIFEKADWDQFKKMREETMTRIDISGKIEEVNNQVTSAIIMAVEEAIPKGKNRGNRKPVPWWNEECHKAVTKRNKAFKLKGATICSH